VEVVISSHCRTGQQHPHQATVNPWHTYPGQISASLIYTVATWKQKKPKKCKFHQILMFWGSCTHTFSPEKTAVNHRLYQIFKLGVPVPTPLCDQGEIWHAWVGPRTTFTRQILPGLANCVTLKGQKPKFGHNFKFNFVWWRHLAVQWQSWMWVHNYKPAALSKVPKPFLYYNAFMAKS